MSIRLTMNLIMDLSTCKAIVNTKCSHPMNQFEWKLKLFFVTSNLQTHIPSYSGPHFSAFGLNTERYEVSLHIQSECRKMRPRITPNLDLIITSTKNSSSFHSADS